MHGCVKVVVVVALSVGWSGFSGLEVPATADAQTRPQPEELWQAYPLHQRPARTVERDDPSEPAGRAPAVAAPMQAGDMGSAVPALLAISLILTAFLLGGALGLVDLPVKLRGGLAAAHAPAAPRKSAARTTAAAVSGAPAAQPGARSARGGGGARLRACAMRDRVPKRLGVLPIRGGRVRHRRHVRVARGVSPVLGGGRSSGRAQPRRGGGPPAPHGPAHRAGLGAGRTWRSLVRSQVPTERAVWCLIMDRKSATFSPAPMSSRPRCSPAPAWPRAARC